MGYADTRVPCFVVDDIDGTFNGEDALIETRRAFYSFRVFQFRGLTSVGCGEQRLRFAGICSLLGTRFRKNISNLSIALSE